MHWHCIIKINKKQNPKQTKKNGFKKKTKTDLKIKIKPK